MLEKGKILRSFWGKNAGSDTKTQLFQGQLLEDEDGQTIEEMHIPGVQYVPPVNSDTLYSRISSAFKIALGIDDKVPKLENLSPGERKAYGSKDGAIVCSIWYKDDGTIQIDTDKDLIANVGGAATVESVGTLELKAPLIKLTGAVECSETIEATGDIIADSGASKISQTTHRHAINSGSSSPGPTAAPTPTP